MEDLTFTSIGDVIVDTGRVYVAAADDVSLRAVEAAVFGNHVTVPTAHGDGPHELSAVRWANEDPNSLPSCLDVDLVGVYVPAPDGEPKMEHLHSLDVPGGELVFGDPALSHEFDIRVNVQPGVYAVKRLHVDGRPVALVVEISE